MSVVSDDGFSVGGGEFGRSHLKNRKRQQESGRKRVDEVGQIEYRGRDKEMVSVKLRSSAT